jgi:hypothetical protein
MLQVSVSPRTSAHTPPHRPLMDRVSDAIDALSCDTVRARTSGPHILLGPREGEPFARLTPLGGGSYGLAFRAAEARAGHTNAWEPLLLVDDLASVIEYALEAVDAVPGRVATK